MIFSLFAYTPFVQPLPGIWSGGWWAWLIVPLCTALAVVYKSIKSRSMRTVPRDAAILLLSILAGMAVAAIVLAIVVKSVESWQA